MKPGTKPIDFATAAARGKRRTDRHGRADEQPELPLATSKAGWPPMPRKVFGKRGRAEWLRVKKLLEHAGTVTQADLAPLVQYCLLYERMVTTPDAFIASDHNALRLLSESLGLSPPGRGRLRGTGEG